MERFAKETRKIPSLVNPENFKLKTPKPIAPEIVLKNNSRKLNIYLSIGFLVFLAVFIISCKYGLLQNDSSPEGYSYQLNAIK